MTLVRLDVSCCVKGSADKEIEVTVPGGTADGITQVNPGLPEFSAGEEVVLFLEGHPLRLMGGGEGKHLIKDGIILGPDMPVQEFIGQVKKMSQRDLSNKRDEAK